MHASWTTSSALKFDVPTIEFERSSVQSVTRWPARILWRQYLILNINIIAPVKWFESWVLCKTPAHQVSVLNGHDGQRAFVFWLVYKLACTCWRHVLSGRISVCSMMVVQANPGHFSFILGLGANSFLCFRKFLHLHLRPWKVRLARNLAFRPGAAGNTDFQVLYP